MSLVQIPEPARIFFTKSILKWACTIILLWKMYIKQMWVLSIYQLSRLCICGSGRCAPNSNKKIFSEQPLTRCLLKSASSHLSFSTQLCFEELLPNQIKCFLIYFKMLEKNSWQPISILDLFLQSIIVLRLQRSFPLSWFLLSMTWLKVFYSIKSSN